MFHSFLSDDRKKDSAKTIAHSKRIIELLKQHNNIPPKLSTLWENIDGVDEHYRCATSSYFMYMSSQAFVIIYQDISASGHVREVLCFLNSIDKNNLLQLISTVQLPGAKDYDMQMFIHTGTCTSGASLVREL